MESHNHRIWWRLEKRRWTGLSDNSKERMIELDATCKLILTIWKSLRSPITNAIYMKSIKNPFRDITVSKAKNTAL
jgi:hypothetical protein